MRWLKRLLLLGSGLVLGVVLAEAAARFRTLEPGVELYYNTIERREVPLFTPHPQLRNVPRAGVDTELVSLDYRVRVRFSSLSLRGGELGPAEKPRWLVVGDSFTMALQVTEEESFPVRLGELAGVEALNAGVDGYGTWQETARYEQLDDAVGAEAVLLAFFLGNDLADNRSGGPIRAPAGRVTAAPPTHTDAAPAGATWEGWLAGRSALYAYYRIAQKRGAMAAGHDPDWRRLADELRPFSRSGAPVLAEALSATEQALTHLRDTAARRGDRLWVALVPPAYVVSETAGARTFDAFGVKDPDPDAPGRAVGGLLRRLGVATCDLTPALREAVSAGIEPYLRYDAHFSAEGHEVVARALAACTAGT